MLFRSVIVVHVPVPGVIGIVLGRTPPVTVITNVVEFTIVVTVAPGKSRNSNRLFCRTGILIP